MPKRNQRDPSPGDARKPFSDRGGPAGRHAETHDVRREELTVETGAGVLKVRARGSSEWIQVSMGKQNALRLGAGVEEARHARQNDQSQQLVNSLSSDESGIEGLPVGVHQGHTHVQNNPRGGRRDFDATAANLLGSPMDGQLHLGFTLRV